MQRVWLKGCTYNWDGSDATIDSPSTTEPGFTDADLPSDRWIAGAFSLFVKKSNTDWQLWEMATQEDYSYALKLVDPSNNIVLSEGTLTDGDTVDVQILFTARSHAAYGMQGVVKEVSSSQTLNPEDLWGKHIICTNTSPITLTLGSNSAYNDINSNLPCYISAIGGGNVTLAPPNSWDKFNNEADGASVTLTAFKRYTLFYNSTRSIYALLS